MNKLSAVFPSQRFAVLLALSALFLTVAAAQAEPRPIMTSHVPAVVSSGAAPLVGHLDGTQRLSLAISLPLRNQAELDELLREIYDPQSPNYHHYLSAQEFASRFGPAESDYFSFLNFSRVNGLDIVDTAANRMVLDVEGPAANIESAFHVTLNVYQHPTEGRTFYAPDREPAADLEANLLHVSGLDNFILPSAKNLRPSPASEAISKTTGSGPNGQFIGSDMRAAYYGSGSLTGAGQSVGLFEFGGYAPSDVATYFKNLNQPFTVPVNGVSVNGVSVNCSKCEDSEQVLDIEMAISMAPGLKEVVV